MADGPGVPAYDNYSAAPASTGVALTELRFSNYNLAAFQDINDGDFDHPSVFDLNGQSRLRFGNWMIEIQGTTTMSVDDTDEDENSSPYGSYVHYISPIASGDIGVYGGLAGGTNVEESDGTWYYAAGVGYSFGDFMIGAGHTGYLGSQDGDDSILGFTYIQGEYSTQIFSGVDFNIDGYYGFGRTDDENHPVRGYQISASLGHDFSDVVSGEADVSAFGVRSDSGSSSGVTGYELFIGLNFAIGGRGSDVRDQVPFDAPNFHREMTWADEAGL